MKKIYITLFFMATFSWMFAQQLTPKVNNSFEGMNSIRKVSNERTQSIAKSKTMANSKGTSSKWFSQPESYLQYVTSLTNYDDYYYSPLFPDTTMLESGNQPADGHIFFHSIAISLDPHSDLYAQDVQPNTGFNKYTNYTLDSISFGYIYQRHTSSTVVDTLVVQIQVNTWQYSLTAAQYAWVNTIYAVSTMKVAAILHDKYSWKSTSADANLIKTLKFPLTEADSSFMPNYLDFGANNLVIPTGSDIKAIFTFVPGYTWIPNVDSIQKYNEFGFLSYGMSTAGKYPMYLEGDYNTNQVLRTWAYRDSTDDAFEPVYFFTTTPFPYQYHDVMMKLTAKNTSIDEQNQSVSVAQNVPNPTNGITTINYNLNEASDVTLSVYNVAGAKVKEINLGKVNTGSHKIEFNASTLESGVYFYTLNAGGKTATRKLVVN